MLPTLIRAAPASLIPSSLAPTLTAGTTWWHTRRVTSRLINTGPATHTHRSRLPLWRRPLTYAISLRQFPTVIAAMLPTSITALHRALALWALEHQFTHLRPTPVTMASTGRATTRILTPQRLLTLSTDRTTPTTETLSLLIQPRRTPATRMRTTHLRSRRTATTPSSLRWAWIRMDSTGNAAGTFPRKPRRSSKHGSTVTATLRTPPRTKRSTCAGRRSSRWIRYGRPSFPYTHWTSPLTLVPHLSCLSMCRSAPLAVRSLTVPTNHISTSHMPTTWKSWLTPDRSPIGSSTPDDALRQKSSVTPANPPKRHDCCLNRWSPMPPHGAPPDTR